jgi:hypothetical protein
VDKDQVQWDGTNKIWQRCAGPNSPSSPDAIGGTTEGNEAAESTSKTFNNAKGLSLGIMTRVAYYDAGDKTLYGYARTLTFDAMGRLYSVSGETRISIDVPVAET